MIIPPDKPKLTQPRRSDAVRELIRNAVANANPDAPFLTFSSGGTADAILSALSDAGLAVLPLEATGVMGIRGLSVGGPRCGASHIWKAMAAAFHPSQLEKTDE